MISSLGELLIDSMRDPAYVDAMRSGIAEFDRFRSALPYIPYSYTRTLLHKTDAFELVAMHWAPGSVSPIHDHGASRCWVVMLEGALDVDNYDRLDDGSEPKALIRMSSRVRVARGELDHRLNWRELHRVRNASDASAFSVQVYAAPQFDFTIVDGDSFECRRVLAKYDAVYNL